MTITVYTFRDKDDHETCSYKTQDYQEAKRYASQYGLKVIGNTFEWSDSELVDDFTGAASDEGDEEEREHEALTYADEERQKDREESGDGPPRR